MKRVITAAALGLAALSLSACGSDATTTETAGGELVEADAMMDAIDEIDDLSMAHDLIEQAGLETIFEGKGAYTLFLPTDAALAELGDERIAFLKSDEGRPELIALFRMHITPGFLTQGDLKSAVESSEGGVALADMAGGTFTLTEAGDTLQIASQGDPADFTGERAETPQGAVFAINRVITG